MIARFCAYSVLKNLRFADPFLLLFFLDVGLSYTAIGALLGFQNLVVAIFEVPFGIGADRFGRRTSLAACFLAYAVAFVLYPTALSETVGAKVGAKIVLYAAATAFALGEALRSGSHKAIMLDYLDGRNESHRATYVVGLTRSFSKFSAGLSALVAGLLLFLTDSWFVLFFLSAVAASAGFILMLTYPRSLEGEQRRAEDKSPSGRAQLKQLAAGPGWMRLLVQSILFESQVRLVTKYYVQIFFNESLRAFGYAIIPASPSLRASSGAVWYGLHEAVRETFGGAASRLGPLFERVARGSQHALHIAQAAAAAALAALAVAALQRGVWLTLGVLALLILTVLYNARKPVFVGAFNHVMDKPQRATALSIHSLAGSLALTVTLPVAGWIADHLGLAVVFLCSAAITSIGIVLGPAQPKEEP